MPRSVIQPIINYRPNNLINSTNRKTSALLHINFVWHMQVVNEIPGWFKAELNLLLSEQTTV